MSNQPSDFSLSALNVYINTEISGLFFQEAITPQLEDTSYQINVRVSTNSVNQLFLFHTSNTLGDTIESDLTDLSSSDFKYAFNVSQWNPSIQTTRQERKLVIENYLIDLFGGNRITALRNIDVFSNEDELDSDISDIFHTRANAIQRQALEPSSNNVHGSFLHNGSLVTALASVINNAASTNPDAVSQKLLEIASILSRDNNNNVLVRQFADTNTSNFDYNLPIGWRTFQFIENDVISFNLTIGQPSSFYPPWSENQSALSNGGTNTRFRINLIVTDSPSGQVADFFTPTITSQQLDTVVQNVQVPNVVATALGISSENFSVISISNEIIDQSNVLIKSSIALDLCFNTLNENNIQSITNNIRDSYAAQLNINPLSINVTIHSGSVIVIIEQLSDLPSKIDLSGLSVITINQTASYIEPGVRAYVDGRTHVNGVPHAVDISLGGLDPSNLVYGNYTITYSLNTNSDISATRQVIITDDIAPVINISGSIDISLIINTQYQDAGVASVIDNVSGDFIGDISRIDINNVSTKIVNSNGLEVSFNSFTSNTGTYSVIYNVQDPAGNPGQAVRTIDVLYIPTLLLNGQDTIYLPINSNYYIDPCVNILNNNQLFSQVVNVDITNSSGASVSEISTIALEDFTINYSLTSLDGLVTISNERLVRIIGDISFTNIGPIQFERTVNINISNITVISPLTAVSAYISTKTTDISIPSYYIEILSHDINFDVSGSYSIIYKTSFYTGILEHNHDGSFARLVSVVDTVDPELNIPQNAFIMQTDQNPPTSAELLQGVTARDNSGGLNIDLTNYVTAEIDYIDNQVDYILDARFGYGQHLVVKSRDISIQDNEYPTFYLGNVSVTTLPLRYINIYTSNRDVSYFSADKPVAKIIRENTNEISFDVSLLNPEDILTTSIGSFTLIYEAINDGFTGDGSVIDIDVTTLGNYNAPYYLFNSISADEFVFNKGMTYNFIRQDTGHAFYISDNSVNQPSQTLIISGDGSYNNGITQNQSFNVTIPLDFTGTITYYCTVHSNMIGLLNLLNKGAVRITKLVNVIDTTTPILVLNGDASMTINLYGTYVEEGAKLIDYTVDGISYELSNFVSPDVDLVDTSSAGVYTLTYSGSDGSNQAQTIERIVEVQGIDMWAGVIQPTNSSYFNRTYFESGQPEDYTYGWYSKMSKDGNYYIMKTGGKLTDVWYNGVLNRTIDNGSVEVFYNNNGIWEQKGRTLIGIPQELMGTSVEINNNGTVIAVGSYWHNNRRGLFRLYNWETNVNDWVEKFTIYGESSYDDVGRHIALNDDGTIFAIQSNGSSYVKIYELTSGSYQQKGSTLTDAGFIQFGDAGLALSSDGAVIIIASITGRNAQVYEWNVTDWVKKGNTLTQTLDHHPGADQFGSAVSINGSGNIIAVGCKYGDKPYINDTGYVELYEWDGNNWIQKGSRLYGYAANNETGGEGGSISLNTNGLIVCYGSSWYDYKGIVQVARFDTAINDWVLINGPNGDSKITNNSLIFNARYGQFVSLNGDGTRFIVNAPYQNDGLIEIYDIVY